MTGIYPVSPIRGCMGASMYGYSPYENYALSQPQKTDDMQAQKAGAKAAPTECETCSNRRYQDGSNEMVSFKSPTRISPEAAPAMVRSHEQEHVSNAYRKAAVKGGEVLSANVAIHTSICPECGRSYVSGGTTTTQIKYSNEENPYQKHLKETDALKYRGMHLDLMA